MMEVVDEGDDDEGDDGREDDNSDRINEPSAELQGPAGHKPVHCLGFALCNVGGRSDA